jgi:hypothetical protein
MIFSLIYNIFKKIITYYKIAYIIKNSYILYFYYEILYIYII